jgi:tetratricopeptide (TPR) repeat protein
MFLNQTMYSLLTNLTNGGNVKYMLDDYQGALEDFNKVNVLEANNAFTLKNHGTVKRMLKEYQRSLEDFDKADVFGPNNALIFEDLWRCQIHVG